MECRTRTEGGAVSKSSRAVAAVAPAREGIRKMATADDRDQLSDRRRAERGARQQPARQQRGKPPQSLQSPISSAHCTLGCGPRLRVPSRLPRHQRCRSLAPPDTAPDSVTAALRCMPVSSTTRTLLGQTPGDDAAPSCLSTVHAAYAAVVAGAEPTARRRSRRSARAVHSARAADHSSSSTRTWTFERAEEGSDQS